MDFNRTGVVSKIKNVLQYPPTIVRSRTGCENIAIVAISGTIIANSCTSMTTIWMTCSVWFSVAIIAEWIHRFALCFEEMKHLKSLYDNNVLNLLCSAFAFTKQAVLLFTVNAFGLIILYFKYEEAFFKLHTIGIRPLLGTCLAVRLLTKIIDLNDSDLGTSRLIQNMNGLDYGSGMAYSFFSGYLKLILPETGDERIHFQELMRIYEDKEHIDFRVHKLFILIPTSLYTPPTICGGSGIDIESRKSLGDIIITRAGVRNRVYKNSVYTITDNRTDKPAKYYVSMEYATPLTTLHEVVNQNSSHANIYKKHRKELVTQFFLTLHELLKTNRACGESCELVYFDDDERTNIGEIIIDRIKQITSE